MDFNVHVDHRVKIKEIENPGKYLELARELYKLWNMKVTVIPIITLGQSYKTRKKNPEKLEIRGINEQQAHCPRG